MSLRLTLQAGVRSADGDASSVSRASLRAAAHAALPDPLSLTIGDVTLNGRDADSLATAVFDLYDVDADGQLSYGASALCLWSTRPRTRTHTHA